MHDAWNRLVKVTQQVGTGAEFTLGEYQYNGLHWRTVKLSDARATPTAPRQLSEKRLMYYDASWRMVHEEVTDDVAVSATPTRAEQQLWGLRYIDDAVMCRRAPIADFATGTLNWQASLWDGDSGKEGLLNRIWQLSDVQLCVIAALGQAQPRQGGRVLERVELPRWVWYRTLPPHHRARA